MKLENNSSPLLDCDLSETILPKNCSIKMSRGSSSPYLLTSRRDILLALSVEESHLSQVTPLVVTGNNYFS